MLLVLLMMVVIVAVAVGVVAYVAFPHRGRSIPGAPWLGTAMNRAVDSAPVLTESEAEVAYAVTAGHRSR